MRLRVAERAKFVVVPLGLELDDFLAARAASPAAPFRDELGIAPDEILATFVGRLVADQARRRDAARARRGRASSARR